MKGARGTFRWRGRAAGSPFPTFELMQAIVVSESLVSQGCWGFLIFPSVVIVSRSVFSWAV